MVSTQEVVFDALDASASHTSGAIWNGQFYGFAVQTTATGSPSGTLKLQGSCDVGSRVAGNPSAGAGVTNWTDVPNSSTSINAAGTFLLNYDAQYYRWIRVVYTGGGTGTIGTTINLKC